MYCNFDSMINVMLRDRLVFGIRDNHIQLWLLVESNLKFAKGFELAQSMEVSARNAKELHQRNADSGTEVYKIKGEPRPSDEKGRAIHISCLRFGEMRPLPNEMQAQSSQMSQLW